MRTLMYLLGAGCLCIALEVLRELHTFRKVRYTVASEKLNGLETDKKIIFLSDLHARTYGKENGRLYQAIREEQPDYILIGGDMLVGKRSSSDRETLSFIGRLVKICPVYYGNGNHEQKIKENPDFYGNRYEIYKSALQERGVCVLENERTTLRWDQINVQITGLEIPLWGYKKKRGGSVTDRDLDTLMEQAGEGFEILLVHTPKYMKAYERWGGDLILSGHYHGGIVGIPGGGVIAPDFRLFPPYAAGMHRLRNGASAIVSRGLGVHTLPFRLCNPAEMLIITLQGENTYGNPGKAAGV